MTPFEEESHRWRAVGNTLSDLTGPRFEFQTSRFTSLVITLGQLAGKHCKLQAAYQSFSLKRAVKDQILFYEVFFLFSSTQMQYLTVWLGCLYNAVARASTRMASSRSSSICVFGAAMPA